jgi:hypothetical protein
LTSTTRGSTTTRGVPTRSELALALILCVLAVVLALRVYLIGGLG